MAFEHDALTRHVFAPSHATYSVRDTMLYALGLGLGADPLDPAQLRFTYERGLRAVPTMGVVLAHPGFWAGDPALGIDWKRMLHVGQGFSIHHPIPVEGSVTGRSRITDVIDLGAAKGALLYYERDVHLDGREIHLATVRQTLLCRGNGGFGVALRDTPPRAKVTNRAADHVVECRTLPQAALLYRLSGDMNPLHADPDVARAAGFERPILHGLATYGVAGAALLDILPGSDPDLLRSFDVRFTAPVFPGETLRTELWVDGYAISLRTRAVERDLVVLDGGHAVFGDAAAEQARKPEEAVA